MEADKLMNTIRDGLSEACGLDEAGHHAALWIIHKMTAWHAGTMFKQSVLLAATAAAAFLQPALASETQLQTARIVEPKQRAEFPLTGEESSFKYSYSEDVRPALTAAPTVPAL